VKATEATLEQELARLMGEKLKVSFVTQPSISASMAQLKRERGRKQLDTLLVFPDCRIVLEVEIGERNLLTGVAQAVIYQEVLGADGSLIIAYPETVRRPVDTQADVIDIVLNTRFSALVLTPFLRQNFGNILLDELCARIKQAKSEPEPTDLTLVVNVLREAVGSLVLKLRRGKGIPKPALERVVNQFELFSKLTGDDNKLDAEAMETIACDLVGYIVVNQILLYFLLSSNLGLPPFQIIHDIPELRPSFKRITDVDYRAVYNIDIVNHLPRRCLTEINKIVLAFRHLRPEEMKHDLLGRMFHEFLPFRTRKVFAAFYTKPVAAEILARLAINRFPERILEPACGSGTLLVAAYQALRYEDPKLQHNQALRKLYALDIMPFAAHLAALNLTLQDLDSKTEYVNVGVANSLVLASGKETISTPDDLFGRIISRRVDVDQKHHEEVVLPREFNVVIMNPPFTDRSRVSDAMLASRIEAFRERQNYWAYFLSLAHDMLAPGGAIAAVLPRLFLAGSTSREVRNWLFNTVGYHLLYIIRTTKEFAFSESAAFRDFLVVLRKPSTQPALPSQPCKVVYLNRSIDEISIAEAGLIADEVSEIGASRELMETDNFTAFTITQEVIRKRSDNLWFTVAFENPKNTLVVSQISARLFELAGNRLTRLRDAVGAKSNKLVARLIPRGFEAKPKGLYTAIFAVKELDEKRVADSDMVITTEKEKTVACRFMEHSIEFPKSALHLGIKTASYFRRFEVTREYGDFVLKARGKYSTQLQKFSRVRINYSYIQKSVETCNAHLLVARRLNVVAPGTTFLAFFSREEMVSPKTFYSVKCQPDQALSISLWMNSVFGLIQFLDKRMETEGGYCEVLKEDLIDLLVPVEKNVPQKLQQWYQRHRKVEFPPLNQQFAPDSPRRNLDREIMLWMGWPEAEVDADLDELYGALNDELQLLREAMKA
jgi:tRNA1(Val) A37 N6-methylase TrmN6